MHAHNTYKSVYKKHNDIQVCPKDKNKRYASRKVNLKESSSIAINFFTYTYHISHFKFFVKTAESHEDIALEYELKPYGVNCSNEKIEKDCKWISTTKYLSSCQIDTYFIFNLL